VVSEGGRVRAAALGEQTKAVNRGLRRSRGFFFYPGHPRNPRLQIPDSVRGFRKWDGKIPTTGQLFSDLF
jgi:hypothetical protein